MTTVNQLRIYRIREGLMDEWLDLFSNKLVGLHDEAGIPVVFAARNEHDPQEFVWMRQFSSAEAVESEEQRFFSLPARIAMGDVRGTYVADFTIRVVSPYSFETKNEVRP